MVVAAAAGTDWAVGGSARGKLGHSVNNRTILPLLLALRPPVGGRNVYSGQNFAMHSGQRCICNNSNGSRLTNIHDENTKNKIWVIYHTHVFFRLILPRFHNCMINQKAFTSIFRLDALA